MKSSFKKLEDLTQREIVLLNLANKLNNFVDIFVPRQAAETALANSLLKLTISTVHRQVLKRLKMEHLIEKRGDIYKITKKGDRLVDSIFNIAKLKQNKKWDHMWRVIIFDIPERRRNEREGMRRMMVTMGFKKLQASVWVSPYPIPQDMNDILWQHKLKPHILYLLVKEVDYSKPLKDLFPEIF